MPNTTLTEPSSLTLPYFTGKLTQPRKPIRDIDRNAAQALEIAYRVQGLCYPMRVAEKVRLYYNNAPFEPYLQAEHPGLGADGGAPMSPEERRMAAPLKRYVVIDIYMFLGGVYEARKEADAFLVEVAMPQGAQRERWDTVRARWCDLGWNKLGNHPGDAPLPYFYGENHIHYWC